MPWGTTARCASLAVACLALAGAWGCAPWPDFSGRWPLSSKWALDDPDYNQKYSQPYPQGLGRYRRMAKQMVDARHVEGLYGHTGSMSGGEGGFGGYAGTNYYDTAFLERYGGGQWFSSGYAGNDYGGQSNFLGLNLGLRLQAPSRVAPFVGVGGFAGGSEYEVSAEDDGIDNDHNKFIDESGEQRNEFDVFGAVFPELGVHAWLTADLRLTASASYYISSEGRDYDFWLVGLPLSFFHKAPDEYDGTLSDLDLSPTKAAPLPAENWSITRLPPTDLR